MPKKSIQGSTELGKMIKARRNELNLTIEAAAAKAGVGTKTWSRYESGAAIRADKGKGICRALNWRAFPGNEADALELHDYMEHEAWSPFLMDEFGIHAAKSFVIGSDILLDNIREDMDALATMPRGSHVGQIGASMLDVMLPKQFLMRYDYDFLYVLRDAVICLRRTARAGNSIVAHRVIDELALYLIVEESRLLMESDDDGEEVELEDGWYEWIFDVFDDMDVITCLYSKLMHLTEDHIYHFDHWLERQFYCE